ncbi:NUDIX hydrolase [Dermacoccaceae bacterium W4C1]
MSAAAVPEWLAAAASLPELSAGPERVSEMTPGGRDSAVLMLFGPDVDGGQNVVLTQRASTLRHHPGQVSFPGGRLDPGDAGPVDAALREATEEIGLDTGGVQVLAEFGALPLTVTGFRVAPVLAWWAQPSPIAVVDVAEVERVAVVPLAHLLDPAHRFTATHPRGFAGPAFEVDGLYVWGFTAILLDEFLTRAGRTLPWDTADRRQVPDRFLR